MYQEREFPFYDFSGKEEDSSSNKCTPEDEEEEEEEDSSDDDDDDEATVNRKRKMKNFFANIFSIKQVDPDAKGNNAKCAQAVDDDSYEMETEVSGDVEVVKETDDVSESVDGGTVNEGNVFTQSTAEASSCSASA